MENIYIYQTLLSKATCSAFRLYICQYVCSLGIEPTTFALLTQYSTTEPQEHFDYIGLIILQSVLKCIECALAVYLKSLKFWLAVKVFHRSSAKKIGLKVIPKI